MASGDSTQRKRNNYKILVDPELKKGHKKVYRLNGKDVAGFPPAGEPKDPRTQKTVLGVTGSTVDLKVPRFKYDKFWNGDPPARDVFVIGLNESVKGSLLREVCTEIATVHSIKFHRHPKTKTFLGAATVSFMRAGEGRRAVGELDGKIVGGCYLRAELDDQGEHLKKYLEPVLKKCGLDKKLKLGKEGELKDSSVASSDVEEGRTRHSSIAESGQELSESEMEQQQLGATPLTPTQRKSSDSFLAPSTSTKLYPFSSLTLSSCTPSSLSEPSSTPIIFSPGLTNCTPSSIDSGISLRTNTIRSPQDPPKTKHPKTFQSPLPPPTPNTPPPPLPPEENAPPLPLQEQEAPPPLPPLPPAPKQDSQDGIENISSDEEEGREEAGAKKGWILESKTQSGVNAISPVSLSPPNSPRITASSLNTNVQPANFPLQINSHFDPSLGLQTLLANRNTTSTNMAMDTSSSPSLYVAVSPGPTTTTGAANTSSYELEVEEISGDESPVMVYNSSFEPLKVESVSDDEDANMDMGGDDMEVCSDDENAQDSVIEVNVPPVIQQQQVFPPLIGGMIPHPPLPPPHFPPGPQPPPPHGFFPHRPPPPGAPFPPPPSHPPPPHGPDFMPPHLPLPPPPAHHCRDAIPPLPDMLPPPPPAPFVKDFPSGNQLPNGYMAYSSSSRFSSNRARPNRNLPPPKNKKESISQEVLSKALDQLRAILLNDVQKKLIESYAYPTLDSFWEKRAKEKQKSSTEQVTEGGEKPHRPKVEPYRRMLPGLKLDKDGAAHVSEEEEEEKPSLPTPRKRLMTFKIPLINRGGQRRDQSLSSVVARRRLFSEEETPDDGAVPTRGSRSYYSDISSEELSSLSESEEGSSGEEEEEGSWLESDRESTVEESEHSEEDEEKEYRDIFGSSEDSEGEEEEKETQPKPPLRRASISGGEEQAKEMETKLSREQKNLSDIEDDILRTSVLESGVLKAEHLMTENENLSRIQLDSKPVKPKPAPPRPQFKRRLVGVEDEILQRITQRGPDKEDVQMFKLALGKMRDEENEMAEGVSWAHYPHISLSAPPPKRRRVTIGRGGWGEEEGGHVTGCARSEGYYKIDTRKKKKYLPHHRMMKHPTTTVPGMKPTSSGRVNRANQRRLASVFSSGDISSDLAKYNQLKARKKQLRFAKSTIHNWGLFAMENIAADEMVIEYVGEVVRQAVADERERRYEAAGVGSSYLFRVDHDYIIDATRNGNLARFINHCCDPNCYAKVINFGTQKKIVIYSKRDIALGEEITYDYKFPIEEDKIPCLCGAPNCRGTLN